MLKLLDKNPKKPDFKENTGSALKRKMRPKVHSEKNHMYALKFRREDPGNKSWKTKEYFSLRAF